MLCTSAKKGVGVMNIKTRGVPSQNSKLKELEKHLGMTAKGTAKVMGTNYNSYKEWKGDRRNMTGPTLKLIDLLLLIKGTIIGKKFGV